MTNWTTLPHENLIAYQVARELLVLVREARIAEAAGRYAAADTARVYAIARGEACKAGAALDIAAAAGECSEEAARVGGALARRLYALLTGLVRA